MQDELREDKANERGGGAKSADEQQGVVLNDESNRQ